MTDEQTELARPSDKPHEDHAAEVRGLDKSRQMDAVHAAFDRLPKLFLLAVTSIIAVSTFSTFRDALAQILHFVPPQISISLLILSISAGSVCDIGTQKAVYVHTAKLKLKAHAWVYVAFTVAVMLVLWFTADSGLWTGLTLSVLVVGNAYCWKHWMIEDVRESIDDSLRAFSVTGRFDGIIAVQAWADYIRGNWQWVRFAVALLLGLAIILAEIVQLQTFPGVAKWMQSAGISNLHPIAIGLFVFVFEGSIWYMRLRTSAVVARVVEYSLNVSR